MGNRNQPILFFQPLFGNVDINGRNSRWLHHDKCLLSTIGRFCLVPMTSWNWTKHPRTYIYSQTSLKRIRAQFHKAAKHKNFHNEISSLIKTGLPTKFPVNHVEIWLVILFESRQTFHAKRIVGLSSSMKLGPGA